MGESSAPNKPMANYTDILKNIKVQDTDCKLSVGMMLLFFVAILVSFLMGRLTSVWKESFLLLDLLHLDTDKLLSLVAVGFLVLLTAVYSILYIFKSILQRKRSHEMLVLEIFKYSTPKAVSASGQPSSGNP